MLNNQNHWFLACVNAFIIVALTGHMVASDVNVVNNFDDYNLFKADRLHISVNYNIGDLFNMPTYTKGHPWVKNHTSSRISVAKATAKRLNNTILNYYFAINSNYSLGDRYPIIPNLLEAVRQYGEHTALEHKLPKHFQEIRKATTLLVHIRSGDKGFVSESHITQIVRLSTNFTDIVVMGGVHNDRGYNLTLDDTAQRTSSDIHKIVDKINNATEVTLHNSHRSHGRQDAMNRLHIHLTRKVVIHYGTNPDDDIYLMSVAANLMLHRGGYTALGGLVCQGKVYFVKELQEYLNNPEYMREIKHPIILL